MVCGVRVWCVGLGVWCVGLGEQVLHVGHVQGRYGGDMGEKWGRNGGNMGERWGEMGNKRCFMWGLLRARDTHLLLSGRGRASGVGLRLKVRARV